MTGAFTLRALLARWPRLLLSAVTVAFGVAIVTGALVFTDTTHAAYERLFNGADRGAQLIISPRLINGTGAGSGNDAEQAPAAPQVPARLVTQIAALGTVSAVAGQITAPATIVGTDGRPLRTHPEPVAMSVLAPPFNGLHYRAGGPPRTAGDVAIDAATAAQQHWSVGDTVTISTGQPARRFLITGIATLGPSGAERFCAFTSAETHRLYLTSEDSQIDVAALQGASLATLATVITRMLPPGLVVESEATQVQTAVNRVSTAFSTLDDGLLAFAIVAVLIGTLVIFNTFSSTATQRRRELALLRALGSTRGQILRASLLEALVIGLLGSVLGTVAGPFVAIAVRGLFAGTGVGVAADSVTIEAGAVAVGFGVGIGVSLLASLLPAVQARRAAPVEALRSSYGAQPSGRPVLSTLLRAAVSAGCEAGGLILTLSASGDQAQRLMSCGIGGGLMLLGALVAGPLMVAGVVWLLGVRRADPIFELARGQALQNRGRTALSASSLMIGVALALVVTVYVSGLRSATRAAITQTVVGDIVVQSENAAQPIPAASVRAVAAIPDLAGVSSLKTVTVRLHGVGSVPLAGVDPTSWPEVYHFSWVSGHPATLADLNPGQVLVEADTARAAGAKVGSQLHVTGPTGQRLDFTVAGIYRDSGLLRGITVPLAFFASEFDQPQLQDIFVTLTHSVRQSVAVTALRRALGQFPGVVVRNQRQLAARLAADVTNVVDLLYALLVLAVLMSLLGIGGSLNLGVQARSGELGMLRALGMTPAQCRSLVRDESVLTALVGGVLGVVVGLGLSVCLIHALAPEGFVFSFPWPACAGSVLAVSVAGVVAAVAPARRAGRVPMLSAITYE